MERRSPLVIRDAREADTPSLRQVFLDSRRAALHWLDGSAMKPEDFDRESAGESVLVAEYEGQVVGLAAWWPPDNFLHSLYVKPGFGRRGIGTQLLEAALAQMGRPVQLKCLTRNQPAMAYYVAHGWYEFGRGQSPEGEYALMQLA